jgi:hypothetical protein
MVIMNEPINSDKSDKPLPRVSPSSENNYRPVNRWSAAVRTLRAIRSGSLLSHSLIDPRRPAITIATTASQCATIYIKDIHGRSLRFETGGIGHAVQNRISRGCPEQLERRWQYPEGRWPGLLVATSVTPAASGGASVVFHPGAFPKTYRTPSDTLLYDLQFRLRCKHCNRNHGFEIAIGSTRTVGSSSHLQPERIVVPLGRILKRSPPLCISKLCRRIPRRIFDLSRPTWPPFSCGRLLIGARA